MDNWDLYYPLIALILLLISFSMILKLYKGYKTGIIKRPIRYVEKMDIKTDKLGFIISFIILSAVSVLCLWVSGLIVLDILGENK